MDFYLSEKNCYQRLEDEFKKYGRLIFCVDFDDTIYDFHKVGRKYDDVISLLHRWEKYSEVVILTGNGEEMYPKIEQYLADNNIKYKGINCDSSVHVNGRKTYANVYIDDRGGLPLVYKMLNTLITKIENGEVSPINNFNALETKDRIVAWIRDWFESNGKNCNAIVGISGGKDSSVVAALCVEALGKDRVIGVMMPKGVQADIDDSVQVTDHLGINSMNINIQGAYHEIMNQMGSIFMSDIDGYTDFDVSEQTKINLGPRLRMSVLYAVAQSMNGRVANTCNLSEDWVGYSTRWGDSVGDFSPLSQLTSDEVVAIGDACGLPYELTHKTPSDGLCGKTDEDNLGFTYAVLNKYIRTGVCEDEEVKNKIDEMHQKNLFKLEMMPSFQYKEEK